MEKAIMAYRSMSSWRIPTLTGWKLHFLSHRHVRGTFQQQLQGARASSKASESSGTSSSHLMPESIGTLCLPHLQQHSRLPTNNHTQIRGFAMQKTQMEDQHTTSFVRLDQIGWLIFFLPWSALKEEPTWPSNMTREK